jgi:hypothetical protein
MTRLAVVERVHANRSGSAEVREALAAIWTTDFVEIVVVWRACDWPGRRGHR